MGLSAMLHLLRYRELAVVHYSGVLCALHLQQAQQSLNSGVKNNINSSYSGFFSKTFCQQPSR